MKAARFLLPPLLLSLALAAAPASAAEGYDLYLTSKESQGVPLRQPSTEFVCSDKIYAVLEVRRPGGETGQRTLHATWRNPKGQDQEHTKYDFQVVNGRARVWVWLKLHRSTEASIVQFMNPSAGMEEFVGQWEINLQIDGDTVAKQAFEVIC